MTTLTAQLAPHVVLLAAGCVLTALVWSHSHRDHHTPGHGGTRARSAADDHDATEGEPT